ncbi:MAG TPA: type I-U CRISPR-associated protein Csb2, partial [Blastocatellia bacterium]|nr:type I-U CRISPR-associated protein Csb2 [Blastocatellia bacterium]
KERAEWPPHPDRVFMALAAAWFETGEDVSEGAALRWLETLEPPQIRASDASFRSASNENRPAVSYVPVNDTQRGRKLPAGNDLGTLKEVGLTLLPEYRSRQPRRFPVAVPQNPVVHFIWPSVNLDQHAEPLEKLLRKVTHIGHTASFVQMWIQDSLETANLVPTEELTTHRLRIFSPGRLDYLATQCNRAKALAYDDLLNRISEVKGNAKVGLQNELKERFGDTRPVSLRPMPGRWQGYARPMPTPDPREPASVFDDNLVVLRISGKRLSLPASLKLTEALRGAILAACPAPIPEWISGHGPEGKASTRPHVALLPLAFVDHEHSDGRMMGVALAVPRQVEPLEAARCFSPFLLGDYGLPRSNKLFDGQWLECSVELETCETPPLNLSADVWTQPSLTWGTITPIGLNRHFDGADKWERAAESVKDACEHIGLPRPAEVLLNSVSWVAGAPHAREFPYLTRKSDGGRIHHTHARILFEKPVRGPVALGAGRYRGYGFCRPVDKETSNE